MNFKNGQWAGCCQFNFFFSIFFLIWLNNDKSECHSIGFLFLYMLQLNVFHLHSISLRVFSLLFFAQFRTWQCCNFWFEFRLVKTFQFFIFNFRSHTKISDRLFTLVFLYTPKKPCNIQINGNININSNYFLVSALKYK